MDSFEFNKVAGAVLGTCLFAMAVAVLSDTIFENHPPETPGYAIAIPDAEHPDDAGTAAPAATPLPVLLADASVSAGEGGVRACQACHSFEKGGPNKVGPNLYGIVGAAVLGHADFNYSSGMKEWGADKTWTFANLDAFLENPRGTVPGTAMSFAGIKNDEKRADVIVYLRSLSDDPMALPEVEKTAAADTGTATDASPEGAGDGTAAEGGEAAGGAAAGGDAASGQSGDSAPAADSAPAGDAAPSGDAAPADGSGDAAPADAPEQKEGSATPAESDPQKDAALQGGADGFVKLVAAATPDDGKRLARACVACHTFDKGGANKVGPNLWNVVDAPVLHVADYNYSKAMKEWGEGKTWTYANLNEYLEAPTKVVKGTKMAFAGIRKEEDRAAVVAYLRSMSDSPAPL